MERSICLPIVWNPYNLLKAKKFTKNTNIVSINEDSHNKNVALKAAFQLQLGWATDKRSGDKMLPCMENWKILLRRLQIPIKPHTPAITKTYTDTSVKSEIQMTSLCNPSHT